MLCDMFAVVRWHFFCGPPRSGSSLSCKQTVDRVHIERDISSSIMT